MFLTCLSNKNSPAPLVYIFLQISGLAALVYYCPTIVSFKQHPEVVLFWLNALITLTFYFNTHLRDPGYIPHDAVFFTDQEEPSEIGSGLKIRKRMDSITATKLKTKKAAAKSKELAITIDPQANERIPEADKPQIKGGQESERRIYVHSTTGNNLCITNVATDHGIILEKKGEEYPPSMLAARPDQEDIEEEHCDENSQISNKEEHKQELDDMVDCEPSVEEGEDAPEHIGLDFNTRSKTDVDVVESGGSPTLKIRHAKSLENKAVYSNSNQQVVKSVRNRNENETPEKKKKVQEDVSSNKKNFSFERERENNLQRALQQRDQDDNLEQKENSGFTLSKLFTKEILKGKPIIPTSPKRDYYSFNDDESSIAHGHSSTPKELSLINLKSYGSRNWDRPQEGEATKASVSSEATSTHKEFNKKRTHYRDNSASIKDQSREIMLISPKPSELPEANDLEKQPENKDGVLYVERRYCTVCDFEQPLRAKHCKECKRCIAQYDHHCPWLGTCIGEKNHLPFYWFLVFQFIEILWGNFQVFEYMLTMEYKHWASENTGRVLLALALTFFLIMLISLLSFHTYLAVINQTTWETLSWYKISYLKEWHEDWGSPFSQGIIKNLHFFCCAKKNPLRRWAMPKYKRPLSKQ